MDTEIINFASNNAWFLTPHIARPREIELAKLDCVTKWFNRKFSYFSNSIPAWL